MGRLTVRSPTKASPSDSAAAVQDADATTESSLLIAHCNLTGALLVDRECVLRPAPQHSCWHARGPDVMLGNVHPGNQTRHARNALRAEGLLDRSPEFPGVSPAQPSISRSPPKSP